MGACEKIPSKRLRFSYPDLQARLPTAGSQRRTDSIFKRVSRHCFRCIQAYCDKLVGPLLGYAMRKYFPHRAIPQDHLDVVKKEYEQRRSLSNTTTWCII